MKALLVLLAIVVLVWLIAGSLRRRLPPAAPKGRAGAPQPMLQCAHCGLHLPRDEALPGRGGVFCGEPHRAAYEKAHPPP